MRRVVTADGNNYYLRSGLEELTTLSRLPEHFLPKDDGPIARVDAVSGLAGKTLQKCYSHMWYGE
ncbi:hypothetical protein PI126_g15665 [Phytophthora idaei]|nr:hypothetical protein PI126_g15665 [Phytophthora idaei]